MRQYVVEQLRRKVIPTLEQVSGKRYDEDLPFSGSGGSWGRSPIARRHVRLP
jgi:hypothetical protein